MIRRHSLCGAALASSGWFGLYGVWKLWEAFNPPFRPIPDGLWNASLGIGFFMPTAIGVAWMRWRQRAWPPAALFAGWIVGLVGAPLVIQVIMAVLLFT